VIQNSSEIALKNGMTVNLLFEQLKEIRKVAAIPLVLMGYFNPVMQYGVDNFCNKCKEIGIDGTIIPDLPLDIYETKYKEIFEHNSLCNIFLVTPQTTYDRIRRIDELSNGFIYLVSSSSTTGNNKTDFIDQIGYFDRIAGMSLRSKILIGFGITDKNAFLRSLDYANGAIIGSSFVSALAEDGSIECKVRTFLQRFF